jgi:tetratricopeptide (TPR) repeat protein
MKQRLVLIFICLSVSSYAFANPDLDLGLAAAKMGKWDIARRSFEKALDKEPLAPSVMYNLGLAHAKSGRHLLGVVWLEAYLASHPDAENASQVRGNIAQLEVLAESRMDDLFARSLEILDAAPFESFSFDNYSLGKWSEARQIAGQFANIGRFDKARETEALAKQYAIKKGAAGGEVKIRKDDEFRFLYARNLAGAGMFDEAWHYYNKISDQYNRGTLAYNILVSPLINNKELQTLFDRADAERLISNTTDGTTAKSLWLAGDAQGLLFLTGKTNGKGEQYNPARLELVHGLLGLGHKKEALELAKEMPMDPEAPMLHGIVRALHNYGGSFGCYEQNPRSTLWRMLFTRQYALSGNMKSASMDKDNVLIPFGQAREQGWEITKEMQQNKAWSFAFAYYASREIDKAVAELAAAGEDVTSFLKIILRHAANTDPRYAVTIARKMDPSHLGPFLLQEEAGRAEAQKDTARAKILHLEAKKLAKQLGGEMPSLSPALRQWLDLAVMFSGNSTISSLPSVLKQVAAGGKVPFEPLSLEPDFVFSRYEYRCPYKGPITMYPSVSRTPMQPYESSRAPEIADAAAYIGEALLYIRGTRERALKH